MGRWVLLQPNDSDCNALDGVCPLSCQDDILNCFLIDNNGFILISKRPAETGKFFGAVDGSVMTQLLNMGMFKRVTMYDYQAMCKMPYHHHSGARPLLSPIYAFLAAVKWLISDFLIFLLEFNMSSFWQSDNLADAHKHKKHDTLQPCDTEYPVFVYEPAIKETNGLIECGDCQKMFVAQQIASSNLLLLVTDATCDCSIFPPVLLDAKEVKYILRRAAGLQVSTGRFVSVFAGVQTCFCGNHCGGRKRRWRAGPSLQDSQGDNQGARQV
uniref:Voltage-dependent calcium channel alpha-2/delta subunit conserved region domain-containing protein n=1 Tax=Dromaius novaehollandiae TaxID=8790 RepID=A0A8C4JCX8_DRONO